ncbi:hypothetical protein ACFX1R_046291 [Malus domestica]
MYPDVPPGGAVAYPTRPGYRKFGDVRATQLIVEVAAARDQHHYDGGPFCFFKPTACKPESLMAIFGIIWGSQNSFPVIKQFVLLCKESQLGKRMPAYGGMKSIYRRALTSCLERFCGEVGRKGWSRSLRPSDGGSSSLATTDGSSICSGGPAPAQASSSSATAPPLSSSSKRPFYFFKPTACKPESLMAFLDPKIIWVLKTPFRFLLTKSKQPFIFLKISHVFSSCRIPTAVNLTQKVDFLRL